MKSINDYYGEFETEEQEIVVYISNGNSGAISLEDGRLIISQFPAMINLSDNNLKEADGRIEQLVSVDNYTQNQYIHFTDNTMYRLLVSKCLTKDLDNNMLPSMNNRYLLKCVLSICDATTEPKELVGFREKYLRDIVLEIGNISFKFNRKMRVFEGEMLYNEYACKVLLSLDSNANSVASSAASYFKQINEHLNELVQTAKDIAAEQLFSYVDEWSDDLSCKEISADIFKNNLKPLYSLMITNDRSYEMCFGDSNMFSGHNIIVSGNESKGVLVCEIVG